MVITVGGIKGGSGKSTLATNLAAMDSARGHRVLLVDADEQGTSFDFAALRSSNREGGAGFDCVKEHGRSVLDLVRAAAQQYDAVVVDVGGRDTASQRAALLASDAAVFPFLARPYDLWTIDALAALLREVRTVNTGLICLSYINRADNKGVLMADTRQMLAMFETDDKILFCPRQLGQRTAFAYAAGQGLAVDEVRVKDRKAIQEMTALREYILDVAQEAVAKRKEITHAHA